MEKPILERDRWAVYLGYIVLTISLIFMLWSITWPAISATLAAQPLPNGWTWPTVIIANIICIGVFGSLLWFVAIDHNTYITTKGVYKSFLTKQISIAWSELQDVEMGLTVITFKARQKTIDVAVVSYKDRDALLKFVEQSLPPHLARDAYPDEKALYKIPVDDSSRFSPKWRILLKTAIARTMTSIVCGALVTGVLVLMIAVVQVFTTGLIISGEQFIVLLCIGMFLEWFIYACKAAIMMMHTPHEVHALVIGLNEPWKTGLRQGIGGMMSGLFIGIALGQEARLIFNNIDPYLVLGMAVLVGFAVGWSVQEGLRRLLLAQSFFRVSSDKELK